MGDPVPSSTVIGADQLPDITISGPQFLALKGKDSRALGRVVASLPTVRVRLQSLLIPMSGEE